MIAAVRKFTVPAFLLLCLLIGGSAQGIWANMALQLLAVLLIVWAGLTRPPPDLLRAGLPLARLAALLALVFVLQLIPLPPDIWTALPGRGVVADGYDLLGYQLPWLPLSLAPYQTLASSLAVLPPLALLFGIVRLRAYEESWIAGAIIAAMLAGVLLGAVQVASSGPRGSAWHLYEVTNTGAVGQFANRNHMATLLLASIPFAVALFASGHLKIRGRGRAGAMIAFGVGGFLIVLVGLALNGSAAGIGLAIPVVAASALILPAGWRMRRVAIPVAALAIIVAVVLLTATPVHSELAGGASSAAFQSRAAIWATTIAAIAETFPAGTGFGSLERVYPLFEDPGAIGSTYINHAHNDYLEIVLEGGAAGVLLILLFLGWWLLHASRVWRSALSSPYARAATIASAAILLHSIVDYPLRTAAIAAVFAACLALICSPWKRATVKDETELRPTRHVKIG